MVRRALPQCVALLVVGACTVSEGNGGATFGPGGTVPPTSESGVVEDDGTTEGSGSGASGGAEESDATESTGGSSTVAAAGCGNGLVDGDESCDGEELDGQTCASQGFAGGGTLACLPDCSGFDAAACDTGPMCGDGVVDVGEQCDGAQLAGQSCASMGFDMGTLLCTATCMYDTSACSNVVCAEMFEDCTSIPCCDGLFCYPIEGNYCGPTP